MKKKILAILLTLSLISGMALPGTMAVEAETGSDVLSVETGSNASDETAYTGTLICELDEHSHSEGECYTLSEEPTCGLTQTHVHDDSCYEMQEQEDEETGEVTQVKVLICGEEEIIPHEHGDGCYAAGELTCAITESAGHAHSEACYDGEKTLVCTAEETPGHTHGEGCYQTATASNCEMAEDESHTHDETCYTETSSLVCTETESEGHTHGDDCYSAPALICGQEESTGHAHGADCYSASTLTCDREEIPEHTHSTDCYKMTLTCEKTEHQHTAECYQEEDTCTCGAAEGETHAEDCPLYVATTAYEKALSELTALEAEAAILADGLDKEAEDYVARLGDVCYAFDLRVNAVMDAAFALYEEGSLTDEEINTLAEKFKAIFGYLETQYGYKEGQIQAYNEYEIVTVDEDEIAYPDVTVELFNYFAQIDEDDNVVENTCNDTSEGEHNDNTDTHINNHPATITSPNGGKFYFNGAYYEDDLFDGHTFTMDNSGDNDDDLIHTNNRYRTSTSNGQTDFDVARKLSQSGYPVITAWPANTEGDPYKDAFTSEENIDGSLEYLFTEDLNHGVKGMGTMTSGGGLFMKDSDGYYYYDARENAAWYDADSNKFVLYESVVRPASYAEEETYTSNGTVNEAALGQFLPFNNMATSTLTNPVERSGEPTSYALSDSVDMFFGMTVEFDFAVVNGGCVNKDDMVFNFLGDDDVLVFVDDVLVLNIAGMHSAQEAWVNFKSGAIYDQLSSQSGYKSGDEAKTTLGQRFREAGVDTDDKSNWVDIDNDGIADTFANNTVHTLKFFYLERGAGLSGCRLQFNLQPLPAGNLSVEKVEENLNDKFCGETEYEFELYKQEGSSSNFTKVTDATYIISGEGATDTYANLDSNGRFKLKGGQTATFISGITVNDTVYVKEVSTGNYTTKYTVNDTYGTGAQTDAICITGTNLYQVTFTNTWKTVDLTIVKTGSNGTLDPNQSFIFRVQSADNSVDMLITIVGNGSTTIKHLPFQNYTVTEDENWSWRYTAVDGSGSQTVVVNSQNETVTVTNNRDQIYWLDGNSWCWNLFKNDWIVKKSPDDED